MANKMNANQMVSSIQLIEKYRLGPTKKQSKKLLVYKMVQVSTSSAIKWLGLSYRPTLQKMDQLKTNFQNVRFSKVYSI